MTIKTHRQKKSKNKNKTRRIKRKEKFVNRGGEPIGHGGFGCAFRPALKCKGVSEREKGRVSKLMTTRHAEAEYKEITKFLPQLKKVPNYKNYYVVDDATVCEPDELTTEDLLHFDEICRPMRKIEITGSNVNENLDKLRVLNLPDGGVDVGDYVDTTVRKDYKKINTMLIELLLNGVLPMNKLGIYHGDIKDANVLIGQDGFAKLIDWGLSGQTTGSSIPRVFYDKPFQYNLPFSAILFNDIFVNMSEELNAKGASTFKEKPIQSFVRKFIHAWNKKRGEGHFQLLSRLVKLSTRRPVMTVIVEYITNIIMKYGVSGEENWLMKYFKDVYLKNLDIWGLITTYSPILEKTKDPHLKHIFAKYLYSPEKACEPIDINELVTDLKKKDA
jgi:serine/threonine protein kinase